MAQGLAWTREHNARAAAVFQRPVPAHRGRVTAAGRVTSPATAAGRVTARDRVTARG